MKRILCAVFFGMILTGYCRADDDMSSMIAAFAGVNEAKVGQASIKWPNGNVEIEADIEEVKDGRIVSGSLKVHSSDGVLMQEIDVINGGSIRKRYNSDGKLMFSQKEDNKNNKVPVVSFEPPKHELKKTDPAVCDQDYALQKDICLHDVALDDQDIGICEGINNTSAKASCKTEVTDLVNDLKAKEAVQNKEYQEKKAENDKIIEQWKASMGIDQIDDNSGPTSPSETAQLPQTNADLSDCDQKSSPEGKNRCLLLRAVNVKDAGICKYINDPSYEKRCEQDVNSN